MKALIAFLFFLSCTTIAMAQAAAPATMPMDSLWLFLASLAKPEFLAKIAAFMIAVQALLRGMSEVLTRASDWLDSKSSSKAWLQKLAAWFSEASWFLGVFLGKFGYGEAKLVTQEKIDQAKSAAK